MRDTPKDETLDEWQAREKLVSYDPPEIEASISEGVRWICLGEAFTMIEMGQAKRVVVYREPKWHTLLFRGIR